MSSAVLMERSALGSSAGAGTAPTFYPSSAPQAPAGWCVLPRCDFKFEKCQGGIKITCKCDDEIAAATLQNLCKSLCEGMCSCCVTCNGISICQCNFAFGICKCEYTKDGVCVTCLSGDKQSCAALQACCDCITGCCQTGCCCYLSFGGTPVCCGTC